MSLTLFHGASPEQREQIQRQGLMVSPEDGLLFLTGDPEYARSHGGDLWAVDCDGLDVWEPNRSQQPSHWISQEPITPDRLRLLT